MPQWLIEALRNHEFTDDEKSSIADDVVSSVTAYGNLLVSVRPTESDRQRRYGTLL